MRVLRITGLPKQMLGSAAILGGCAFCGTPCESSANILHPFAPGRGRSVRRSSAWAQRALSASSVNRRARGRSSLAIPRDAGSTPLPRSCVRAKGPVTNFSMGSTFLALGCSSWPRMLPRLISADRYARGGARTNEVGIPCVGHAQSGPGAPAGAERPVRFPGQRLHQNLVFRRLGRLIRPPRTAPSLP